MGNRVVKFRGKRVDNGEWVYGLFIPSSLEGGYGNLVSWGFIRRYDWGKMETIEVDRETVGEFTGLHDKNGVEIYEGDVVKDGAGQINPIVFSNSTYWFNWLHLIDAIEPLTVIGTIHDKEN